MENESRVIKVLLIGDSVSKALYDYFDKERVKDVDLILCCGDLPQRYLSFLVSMTNVPLLYVHGNHDESYTKNPPDGCICIDDKVALYHGLRITGLGGSMRYIDSATYQYTQKEMNQRIRKLKNTFRLHRGFDILLSHSPAWKINDWDDLPHTGFQGFVKLLDQWKPDYFIHGHVHMSYGRQFTRLAEYKTTRIVNGYEWYILDIPVKEYTPNPLKKALMFLDKKTLIVT